MFRLFSPKDESLVQRAIRGQREAFDSLVHRHLPEVRAVAYAYTGNFADAEDVAQETFVKALLGLDGLREPAKFGAWLLGIARNTCLQLRTTRARESALIEKASLATTVEPDMERRELRAAVRKRLDELDEPHREVILLHYFAGRKLKEIAALLDISEEAARKRLQRARESLGALLLADLSDTPNTKPLFQRDTTRIVSAIAAVPYPWSAAPSVGIGAASLLGGLMGAKAVAVIAAGAVLAAAALSATVLYPRLSAPVSLAQPPAPSTSTVAAANAAPPTPAQAKTARPNPAVLSGFVRDSHESPVAGATVHLGDYAAAEARDEYPTFIDTTTDSNGAFRFEGLAPSKRLMVRPEKAGMVCPVTDADGTVVMSGNMIRLPKEGRADVVVHLWPEAKIRGYVTDASGRPFTNDDVISTLMDYVAPPSDVVPRSWSSFTSLLRKPLEYKPTTSTKTGARGEFELAGLLPGAHVLAVAPELQSHAIRDAEVKLAEGQTVEGLHIIVRENPLSISGRVLDAQGRPVPKVFVQAPGGQRSPYDRTAPDGSYRLTRLAEGNYHVVAVHKEYEHASLNIAAGNHAADFVLTRKAAKSTVNGRVVDARTGTPVTRFEIQAVEGKTGILTVDLYAKFTLMNDPKGRFTLEGVPAGMATLVVRAPGYRPGFLRVGPEPGKRLDGVTVKLARGAVVEGRTLSTTGAPVADALIFTREIPDIPPQLRELDKGLLSLAETRSDAEGRFRIDTVAPGQQVLSAYSAGNGRGKVPIAPTDSSPLTGVTIVLGRAGNVKGRVTSGENPLEGVSIFATPLGGLGVPLARARTDVDGNYILRDLVPGEVTVAAHAGAGAASRSQMQDVTLDDGMTAEASFNFSPAEGIVEGTVTVLGAPAERGQIRLHLQTSEGYTEQQFLTVGSNGQYRIEHIPSGTGHLIVSVMSPEGDSRGESVPVETDGASLLKKDIDFSGRGTVTGVISGVPATFFGTVVALEGEVQLPDNGAAAIVAMGPAVRGSAKIGDNGAYRIEGLETGTYTLAVMVRPTNGPEALDSMRYTTTVVQIDENTPCRVDLTAQ